MNEQKDRQPSQEGAPIAEIIEKALQRRQLSKQEISALLSIRSTDGDDLELLFRAARSVREEHFGRKVFIYGFVYFTTFCRNDCNFCYYRKSNDIGRYRKTPDEIVQLAKKLADSGVHLIDLTMGEDPQYHREHFASLLEIISRIKETTGLPVMISPGVVEDGLIEAFAELGTEWYALYQETHNRKLYGTLRNNQDFDARMHAKEYAKEQGMLIEEGILTGVGETLEDIAESLLEMGRVGASQIRVMTFVPQKGIPMELVPPPHRDLELVIIAVMRLLYPEALIPASLDIEGIAGLRDRMEAGANLITSIIPPLTGLAGVAQSSMNVDDGGRTVAEVVPILESIGMEAATAKEYADWLKKMKKKQLAPEK